jgi:chromosome segregation ATPase
MVDIGQVIGPVLAGVVSVFALYKSNESEKKLRKREQDDENIKMASGSIEGFGKLVESLEKQIERAGMREIEMEKRYTILTSQHMDCEKKSNEQAIQIAAQANQIAQQQGEITKNHKEIGDLRFRITELEKYMK